MSIIDHVDDPRHQQPFTTPQEMHVNDGHKERHTIDAHESRFVDTDHHNVYPPVVSKRRRVESEQGQTSLDKRVAKVESTLEDMRFNLHEVKSQLQTITALLRSLCRV